MASVGPIPFIWRNVIHTDVQHVSVLAQHKSVLRLHTGGARLVDLSLSEPAW